MKLKSVVSVIVLALAVGTIPTAATGASSAAAPTYKRYTVCAKLHKDYPRGIAHPRARVAKGSKYAWDKHPGGKKYKYRPSLFNADAYNLSKGRDRDGDSIACEVT